MEQPVAVFHGSDDRWIPPAIGRRLALRLPNARIHELAGVGHFIPRQLHQLILDEILHTRMQAYPSRMSVEENKAIVRRFFDEFVNGRNTEVGRQLLRPDYVDHNPLPGMKPGIEGLLAFAAMVGQAFPDLHVAIEDVFGEGDRVAVRVTIRGTHEGTLMGRVEPTGRKAVWTGIDIFRIADGRIVEVWRQRDTFGLMAQLEARD